MRSLMLLLLAATTALAQTQETPPAPGTPRDFAIPEIHRLDLPNGLRVRFVQYGKVPKATVQLVTQTGNVDEQENEVWLADLTATMLEQGTKTRSANAIAREVALMGGALRISATANQTTVGTDVFSESAPAAVALIGDVIRQPLLPESDLPRVKTDLARRLSMALGQPRSIASAKFAEVVYPGHAYGRYFPTEGMLKSYTIEQVRGFHERNFGARRTALYVVGRFDRGAVEESIRRAFGDWQSGEPASAVRVEGVRTRTLHFIERPGAVQSTINVGLPVADAAHPDYLPLTVMNTLLGGSFDSRITANIRGKKGYAYSPSGTVTTRVGTATWIETADVTTNVTGPAIREIFREIERMRAEAPSEAELRGIQNFLAGTFVLRNSSRPGIAAQLAFLDLYGLSEEFLRTYVQRVYALTPADIQRLAKTYIDPAAMTLVVVGDPSARDQLKEFD